MKKAIKDNVLYSMFGGKAEVSEDGKVTFTGEEKLYKDAYIKNKKFNNKRDAVLMLLNAGWFYKKEDKGVVISQCPAKVQSDFSKVFIKQDNKLKKKVGVKTYV